MCVDLLGCELLEVAGVEVAGVVDEHVDPAEPFDGRGDRGLGGCRAGDVELSGEQIVVLAERLLHCVGVAAGCDDGVAGGERRLGEVDAHSAAGAGDEPYLLVSHPSVLSFVWSRAFRGAGAP